MAITDISTKWRWILAICAVLVMTLLFVGPQISSLIGITSGYKAKILCSSIFVSQRKAGDVLDEDLSADDLRGLSLFTSHIDHNNMLATAHLLFWPKRTAIYRKGLGCTLLNNSRKNKVDPASFQRDTPEIHQPVPLNKNLFWPHGSSETLEPISSDINQHKLKEAIDWAFTEESTEAQKRTRALVVVHKGKLIAERYAKNLSSQTPLHSSSIAKSVTNALTGILVYKKALFMADDNLFIEWQNDARADITLDHLLRMSSGLSFYEKQDEYVGDVSIMLYLAPSAGFYAASKRLEATPGTLWQYSSGTSNIIQATIKSTFLVSGLDTYLNFPRELLFGPLGMHNTIIETDVSNTFFGSSNVYGTARDWARFGLLYLQDGIWNGQRILPEKWVAYSHTDNGTDPLNQYAAHFWLKVPDYYKDSQRPEIKLPIDTYFAIGMEGQFITLIPSKELVIVRMGLTRQAGAWDQELSIKKILDALKN